MISLVSRDSLFGVVIAPILWAIYFVISYLVSGIGCSLGYGGTQLIGMNLLQLLLLAAGIVIAGLMLIIGIQANHGRRSTSEESTESEHADSQKRQLFLYVTTLTLCALSLVGTIWLAMASIIVPICQGA